MCKTVCRIFICVMMVTMFACFALRADEQKRLQQNDPDHDYPEYVSSDRQATATAPASGSGKYGRSQYEIIRGYAPSHDYPEAIGSGWYLSATDSNYCLTDPSHEIERQADLSNIPTLLGDDKANNAPVINSSNTTANVTNSANVSSGNAASAKASADTPVSASFRLSPKDSQYPEMFFTEESANIKIGVLQLPLGDGTEWNPMMPWRAMMRLNAYIREPQINGIILVLNGDIPIQLSYAANLFSELRLMSQYKPIVALIAGSCTEGCYYVAAGARHIVAGPQARIGGIGASYTVERLRNLKLNGATTGDVETTFFSKGKYKLMFESQASDLTDDEKKELQTLVDDQYEQFCNDIASARRLNKNDLSVWADAKVMSGVRAVKIGLIDEIGSLSNAINAVTRLIFSKVQALHYNIDLVSYVADDKGELQLKPFESFVEIAYGQSEKKHA